MSPRELHAGRAGRRNYNDYKSGTCCSVSNSILLLRGARGAVGRQRGARPAPPRRAEDGAEAAGGAAAADLLARLSAAVKQVLVTARMLACSVCASSRSAA